MLYQIIGLVVVLGFDLIYNYHSIKDKVIPNHIGSSITRVILLGSLMVDSSISSWIGHCLVIIPIYSFLFDVILNSLRGERISYIGIPDNRSIWNLLLAYDGSFSLLNQLQLKTIGEVPAFWFKTILFIFCSILFLHNFNPYF